MLKCGMSLLACWIIVGCGVEDAQLGKIEVPLTAPGSDGVLYRLPTGTQLDLYSDPYYGSFSLDGGAASLSFEVPTGYYPTPQLLNPMLDTSASWPLIRQNPDGTVDQVDAALDPIPGLVVSNAQPAQLVLQFHVAKAGAIRFVMGNVDVSVAVAEEAPAGYVFTASGTLSTARLDLHAAPALLADRLAQIGTGEIRYAVRGEVNGWQMRSNDVACAPSTMVLELDAPGPVLDIAQESAGDGGLLLCIGQSGDTAFWWIARWREGAPTTPLLDGVEVASLYASTEIDGAVHDVLLDRGTLHLERLAAPRASNSTLFQTLSDASQWPSNLWAVFAASGPGTMQLAPKR